MVVFEETLLMCSATYPTLSCISSQRHSTGKDFMCQGEGGCRMLCISCMTHLLIWKKKELKRTKY